MADLKGIFVYFLPVFVQFPLVLSLEYCEGNYWCDKGHCCGKGKCCTYNYYELWWFWIIWLTIALLGCCCFYQRKRLQRRRRRRPRTGERSSSGRQSQTEDVTPPVNNTIQPAELQFYPPVFEPGKELRLPTYEEISDLPKDPPSYNLLYNTSLPQSNLASVPEGATCSSSQLPPIPEGSILSTSHTEISSFVSASAQDGQLAANLGNVTESMDAGLLDNAVEPSSDEVSYHTEPPPYSPHNE